MLSVWVVSLPAGLLCCGVFVSSMYMWPSTWKQNYDRDHPREIRRRMMSLCLCSIAGFSFLWSVQGETPSSIFSTYFLSAAASPTGAEGSLAAAVRDVVSCCTISATLFLGVIGGNFLGRWKEASDRAAVELREKLAKGPLPITQFFTSARSFLKGVLDEISCEWRSVRRSERALWIFLRTFIVCPLGEEWYFRAVMFNFLHWASSMGAPKESGSGATASLQGRLGPKVIQSAVIFGCAHLHHCYRLFREALKRKQIVVPRSPSESAGRRFWRCVFLALREVREPAIASFAITFTFGMLSGHLFVSRHFNVVGVAISHAFCNYIGPPSLRFLRDPSLSKPMKAVILALFGIGVAQFAGDVALHWG